MVQRASPSLKRRRSWLEIGIAGCSLLASPAEAAAWPSFGSIWSSFSHAPAHDHLRAEVPRARQHGDHHGTHPAASVPSHRNLGLPPASQTSHQRRTNRGDQQQHPADHVGPARPALQASVEGTPPLPPPPSSTRARALEVEIAVHGRHGDWQACSPDTCTQTRLVFCETLGSRIIVADDLCGEELPDAEQPCSDEAAAAAAAVCGDDAAAAPSGAGRDGKRGAGATSTAGKGVDTRGVGGKGVETGGSRNRAPSSSPSTAAGNTPQKAPPAAAGSRGVGGPQGAQVASPGAPSRGISHESPSKTSDTTVPVEDRGAARAGEPSEEGDARGGDETDEAAAAKKTGSAATDNGSREEEQERRGAAQDRNKSSETSSPKQDEAGKKSSSSAPHDEEPSPPVLARIGGTASKSSREEYRFWVVLAIGAGAVGSFMAVVVFAVGQYRKEQHRLRGIMALNEFPQDNYINPFARQLSSELQLSADDRSAFKL
ncbi:unnamed protein product [Scytosiphon promiscuus]